MATATNTSAVGSLLWVKVGKQPYWPCMISYDPWTGEFFKKEEGRKGEITNYHVQYFGKSLTHGWTTGVMFSFEGQAKYLKHIDNAISNASTSSEKKKIRMKFHVPNGSLKDWKLAVVEAEKASRYRVEDRFELFVFKYDVNLSRSNKETTKKRKKRRCIITKPKKKVTQPIITVASSIVEPLCFICERGSIDLCCNGLCGHSYHKSCVGIIKTPKNFLCTYCATNSQPPCIVCKSVATETTKCSSCTNYYHDYCLKQFKNADINKNICSAHNCWSCYIRNRRTECSKGSLVTCYRCPTAFHDTLECLPVGGVRLSPDKIVCPEHFLGKNRVSPQCVNSISFCSSCYQGGELVCCDSCPNAYHPTCIKGDVPLGEFHCDDCVARKYLYVGDIVWAKCGDFRWWPAQVLHMNNVPLNIKKLFQFDGEFPVVFFGSDEYFWAHRAKVFLYNEVNRNLKSLCSRNSNAAKEQTAQFIMSLEEAAEAYAEYKQQLVGSFSSDKPAPYRHIRVNRPIPPAVIVNEPQSSCMCDPSDANPCGSDSFCLNRSMLMECHLENCPAKERCQNQRFQKREYPSVKVIKTENRGFGLKTKQFISKGSFVIEYVGEIITTEEYHNRVRVLRLTDNANYYFLYIDNRRLIDAGPSGNLARFINHSCSPNCIMEKWLVNNDLRIGIFALRDIECGEELTFNYQSEVEFGQNCNCGSSNCLGIIGRKNGGKNGKKKNSF